MIARSMREESPNSAGQVWFLTGTGSDPRESATENTPPRLNLPLHVCSGNAQQG